MGAAFLGAGFLTAGLVGFLFGAGLAAFLGAGFLTAGLVGLLFGAGLAAFLGAGFLDVTFFGINKIVGRLMAETADAASNQLFNPTAGKKTDCPFLGPAIKPRPVRRSSPPARAEFP